MSPVARWEIPQPIVLGGVISYVSCLLREGMNIRQGGDYCSMWLIFVVGGTIGWRGGLGVFLEFSFLRVNINTLLYKPNFNIVKILFFPVSVDVGNLSHHVKSLCSSFLFFFLVLLDFSPLIVA